MSTYDEIVEFNTRMCAALARKDLDGVLDCFTEDAMLLAPGAPIVSGHEALREWWAGFFAAGFESAEMTPHTVVIDSPDHVVEVGTYTMRLPGPDGEITTDQGKYSVTYRRGRDGRLRYAVDALNSSLG